MSADAEAHVHGNWHQCKVCNGGRQTVLYQQQWQQLQHQGLTEGGMNWTEQTEVRENWMGCLFLTLCVGWD